MPNIIVNPGSGAVANANETDAIENIKHYIVDCCLEGVEWARLPKEDEDGRFSFLLYKLYPGYRCHTIDMPGLPLDQVRYIGPPQDIWRYPRLYIDGGSWIWKFRLLQQKDFERYDNQ